MAKKDWQMEVGEVRALLCEEAFRRCWCFDGPVFRGGLTSDFVLCFCRQQLPQWRPLPWKLHLPEPWGCVQGVLRGNRPVCWILWWAFRHLLDISFPQRLVFRYSFVVLWLWSVIFEMPPVFDKVCVCICLDSVDFIAIFNPTFIWFTTRLSFKHTFSMKAREQSFVRMTSRHSRQTWGVCVFKMLQPKRVCFP